MVLSTLLSLMVLSSGSKASASVPTCCGDMNRFAKDPAFLAEHLSPLPVNFHLDEGKTVTFSDSDQKPASGYWVNGKAGSQIAIVLVHEFWGLNDYIRREAERLHDETGYAVLAVDLYEGKTSTDAREASNLMQHVDKARASAIVKGAVSVLKSGALGFTAQRIGSVGYCFGGGWSEQVAILGGNDVQACVMYYGMPDTTATALNSLKAPVLFIHAGKDQWINDDVVAGFKTAMTSAGKPFDVLEYDADHAFANPSNPHYNAVAATDAHNKELAFFKKNLE